MKKGKFIVIYGANNLGKSLQVNLLYEYLKNNGTPVKKIKYAIYDLKPTGPIINDVLRKGKNMSEDKLQTLYAQNRRDYEKQLKKDLENGIWVIAEDYTGTGIAWGMVRGVSLDFLETINKDLLKEDIAIVFCGKRFDTGIEKDHRNETDESIWKRAYENHMFLADRYHWKKIEANQPIEKVHKAILGIVEEAILHS